MHPTADTPALIFLQSLGAAGDAGRWAASGRDESSKVQGRSSHERKQLRLADGAWFSSPVCDVACGYRQLRAPRCFTWASPPNKPMHPTADTNVVIHLRRAGRRVIGGVRLLVRYNELC